MSMIGLFTTAPQATGSKASAGDAKAVTEFGSTLQGALDALAQAETGEASTETTPLVELVETTPLVELVETAMGNPAPASTLRQAQDIAGSASASAPVSGTTPLLVELVETPVGNATAASASSASGSVAAGGTAVATATATATPLVELVETPAGNPTAASTNSASGTVPASGTATAVAPAGATATPLVELVETGTGSSTTASTSSASGTAPASGSAPVNGTAPAVSTTAPLVELVETRAGNPVPASTSSASGSASAGVAASAGIAAASTSSASGVASASGTATATEAAPAQQTTTTQQPAAVPAPAATAPTQAAAPATPVAAPVPTAPPFASQLARPIFSLASAGAGDHVMTVSVTPDNLGPVTVRAHVGAEGVRVELFAPNDLGRDAIRAIMPELRRDLAGAGLGGNLSLSSQNQPSAEGGTHGSQAGLPGDRDAQRGGAPQASAPTGEESLGTQEPDADRPRPFGATTTIDVMA